MKFMHHNPSVKLTWILHQQAASKSRFRHVQALRSITGLGLKEALGVSPGIPKVVFEQMGVLMFV